MDATQALLLTTVAALGLVLVMDGLGYAGARVRLGVGAGCLLVAAVVGAFGKEDTAGQALERAPASDFPGGGNGLVDSLKLRTTDGRTLTLGHSGFGAYVGSNDPQVQFFVGQDGRPGELGVTPREPGGPNSGSALFARDASDRYSLLLDNRVSRRPRLLSESPSPLAIETPAGVDLRLAPGTGRKRRAGRVVVQGTHSLTLDPASGTLVLPALPALPRTAPRGSLALVGDQLFLRLGTWVPLSTGTAAGGP